MITGDKDTINFRILFPFLDNFQMHKYVYPNFLDVFSLAV